MYQNIKKICFCTISCRITKLLNNLNKSYVTFIYLLVLYLNLIYCLNSDYGYYSDKSLPRNCKRSYRTYHINHTACKNPNYTCNARKYGFNKYHIKEILSSHNNLRNGIANGSEIIDGFPSASNMIQLDWDDELAAIAQSHAKQCVFAHDCYQCRRSDNFEDVGQNLFIYRNSKLILLPKWKYVIKLWYEECKNASKNIIVKYKAQQDEIGNFTQIIWAHTRKIGCGFVAYEVKHPVFKIAHLYTCNYGPGGNFIGQQTYQIGPQTSRCPSDTRPSSEYKGLCKVYNQSTKENTVKPIIQKKQTSIPQYNKQDVYNNIMDLADIIYYPNSSIRNNINQESKLNNKSLLNYCKPSYRTYDINHTACKPPNDTCHASKFGFNKYDIKEILSSHNNFRNGIANGSEIIDGFPSASNMIQLEWDDELAAIAQSHANQCVFAHDCHLCRKSDNFEDVGQNLFIYRNSKQILVPKWNYVINLWYEESKKAPKSILVNYKAYHDQIGHFTQIIWAHTRKIGCGFVAYEVNHTVFKIAHLYTCNYGPGGNFIGQQTYQIGPQTSLCPSDTKPSSDYNGLCKVYNQSTMESKVKPIIQKQLASTPQYKKQDSYQDIMDLADIIDNRKPGITNFINRNLFSQNMGIQNIVPKNRYIPRSYYRNAGYYWQTK